MITIAIFLAVIFLFILWRKKLFSVFKDIGIPGPKPNLIFGNFLELAQKNPLVCQKEWTEKYGKVFGFYLGAIPIVVVSDLELLKKIQISEFHSFINRPKVFGGHLKPDKNDGFSHNLTASRDKRWKEIRSILTPSFTASKMRVIAPMMNETIDIMMGCIQDKVDKDEGFDIYEMYRGLTMDVISRTAFGISTDCQRNPDDPFLKSAKLFFSGSLGSWFQLLASVFPELSFFWLWIRRLQLALKNNGVHPVKNLLDTINLIVTERRNDKSKCRKDVLQLMIDAEMTEAEMDNLSAKDLIAGDDGSEVSQHSKDTTENNDRSEIRQKIHSMADYEIIHNALLFYLAGYETTSTALAFVTHFLVHYPEVQEKIREEVNELIDKEGTLDYSSVQKLQYLDQVLKESLRMYPPAFLFVTRETGENIQFKNYRLKKGLTVQVPAYLIQHDADNWPDPEKFDPERFSAENRDKYNPLALQVFGAGPRNCVGMRFSLMEQKLALAKILRKYRLVACEKTEKLDIELKVSPIIITPKNGVFLKAVPL